MQKVTLKIAGKPVQLEITNEQAKVISDAYVKSSMPLMERLKTFEDILADQNISQEDFDIMIKNDSEDEAAWKRAKLISLALNERPLTTEDPYYVPVFNKSGFGFSYAYCDYWVTGTNVGSRLIGFKTSELSDYAGKTFSSIYKPLL